MSGAQERANRQNRYDQALVNMQEYRDKAYETNELAPWKMKLDAYNAEQENSKSMIFGGLNQAGSGLLNANKIGIDAGKSGFFGKG